MLTLSSKADYGLVLLSLLSRRRDFVSVASLSRKSHLPSPFLSRIAAQLSSVGFLESKEGAGGGYRLAKKPQEISVGEVIKTLEGSWGPTKCTRKKEKCLYESACPLASVWRSDLSQKMWQVLNSYTLGDLIS